MFAMDGKCLIWSNVFFLLYVYCSNEFRRDSPKSPNGISLMIYARSPLYNIVSERIVTNWFFLFMSIWCNATTLLRTESWPILGFYVCVCVIVWFHWPWLWCEMLKTKKFQINTFASKPCSPVHWKKIYYSALVGIIHTDRSKDRSIFSKFTLSSVPFFFSLSLHLLLLLPFILVYSYTSKRQCYYIAIRFFSLFRLFYTILTWVFDRMES